MRNKDVLKKLKNLPDNTKEYVDKIHDYHKVIDNAIEFEIANGTISSLSTYSQSIANGDAHNKKYINSNKIIDVANGVPILITISDGDKHMYIKSCLNSLVGEQCFKYNINISFYNNQLIQLIMYKDKNFDSSFNLVESKGCCFTINYGGSVTNEQYKYLDSLNISILLVDYNYLTFDNVVEYTPTKDYNPATKKYVDDNIGNMPLKKIISTEKSPIIISELSDGIYDFGTTSFVKMFSSDTEILKNVLGICILYSISDAKKILFVNFKSNIAIFNVEDRYALDIKNKTYTNLQFTKLVSIGGSSNTPLVLLDEITENGGESFGLYQTTCSSLKLTANSKIVSLDTGSKILLVTSSSVKEIRSYKINSFGAFSIKKIKYEYNTNTKEATLKSADTAVFKSDLDNTIYDVKKNDTYIRAIYGNPFSILNESIKNATYVNNDKSNNKNVARYFNIDKAIDNITDFDQCVMHLKFYRYGELKIYRTFTRFNRPFNYFSTLFSTDDCMLIIELVPDKQINENLEEIDAKNKCYCCIKYATTAKQEAIDIIDTGNIEIQMANNRILQLNNTKEFVPTEDYNPATKKYVDDATNTLVKKDTNKYILITNDDTLIIKKDSITDITDATVTIDNLTGKFGTLVSNDNGTYSYTLNTIMTDVETFTFKVNDVEQKLVIVPYKEMTYDDKNAGITYDDNWTIEENTNCYNNSIHKKNDKNISSYITIKFKGTAIDIIGILVNKTEFDTSTMTYRIFKGLSTDTANRVVNKTFSLNANNTEYKSKLNFNENVIDFNLYTLQCAVPKNSNLYVDSIIVYNTLGDDINQSILNLYENYSSNSVLYINKANYKFNPTRLYDPTTKKYVDDLVESSKTAMCTDEEVNDMLNEVLGGDYSGN